jgi:hypothetical protein
MADHDFGPVLVGLRFSYARFTRLVRHPLRLRFVISLVCSNDSGDSLSSIEYDVNGPPPDESNPIGNPPYPGWTTSGGANWVGYLSTEYNQSTVLTHDFAQSGAVVQWVEQQVNEHFLPFAGRQPDWAPWTANESLFGTLAHKSNLVTWIGTNDVMQWKDIQGQLTLLFQLQEKLYNAGARNFVYFTIPPFDRSPIRILLLHLD